MGASSTETLVDAEGSVVGASSVGAGLGGLGHTEAFFGGGGTTPRPAADSAAAALAALRRGRALLAHRWSDQPPRRNAEAMPLSSLAARLFIQANVVIPL
mmetsp:Transcript_43763/g.123778  ORF Transcript_43763/g.123778 Transcript_43763/m.123778 type:complete len:100 (+) Transcript_43763:538-837(+)